MLANRILVFSCQRLFADKDQDSLRVIRNRNLYVWWGGGVYLGKEALGVEATECGAHGELCIGSPNVDKKEFYFSECFQ